ncbi:uncharacterized protein [Aegilops tauschii subsp. strangulata]|uniref:uncharacterized protein n=1 Tax=Aegilops tauschii subsp. strangulata TaxID=200361 RepID=UPI003CC87616
MARVLKWLWLPKGTLDPTLGFPATKSEARRFGHSARSLFPIPPPPPLVRSFAEVLAMGSKADQQVGKCPLPPLDPAAERGRERELHAQAKVHGTARDGEAGGWGPPSAWWLKDQECKKRKKEEHKRKGLELKRIEEMPQFQGGRIGDPFAAKKKKKYKATGQPGSKPPSALQEGSSKGTTAEPIPMEEADDRECFKCGRAGHFQSTWKFTPLCILCSQEGHVSACCPLSVSKPADLG